MHHVSLLLAFASLPLAVVALASLMPEPLHGFAVRFAWATLAAGVCLMAFIDLGGRLANRGPAWLVRIQRWTLWLTVVGVSLLVAARFVLLTLAAAALLGLLGLPGDLPWSLLPAAPYGAGAALVVLALVDAAVSPLDPESPCTIVAAPVSRDAGPAIWQVVDEVARAMGTLPPAHLVLSYRPDFMALERVALVGGPVLSGPTLVCSLPLCDLLSRDELRAVIGHELGHFRPEQMEQRRSFWEVFRRTRDVLQSLTPVAPTGESVLESSRHLAEPMARRFFVYFISAFHPVERRLAREEELRLDTLGAAVTSPRVMASALAKLQVYAPMWPPIEVSGFLELAQNRSCEARTLYRKLIEGFVSHDGVRLAAASDEPDILASHPDLFKRLENLDVPPEVLTADVLDLASLVPASSLLPPLEEDTMFAAHVHHQLEIGAFADVPDIPSTAWSAAADDATSADGRPQGPEGGAGGFRPDNTAATTTRTTARAMIASSVVTKATSQLQEDTAAVHPAADQDPQQRVDTRVHE